MKKNIINLLTIILALAAPAALYGGKKIVRQREELELRNGKLINNKQSKTTQNPTTQQVAKAVVTNLSCQYCHKKGRLGTGFASELVKNRHEEKCPKKPQPLSAEEIERRKQESINKILASVLRKNAELEPLPEYDLHEPLFDQLNL